MLSECVVLTWHVHFTSWIPAKCAIPEMLHHSQCCSPQTAPKTLYDAVPTFTQHCVNVLCLLGDRYWFTSNARLHLITTGRWNNVGLWLARRLRRRPNIKPTSCYRFNIYLMFAGWQNRLASNVTRYRRPDDPKHWDNTKGSLYEKH